jgi:hypothetical protein
VHEIVNAIPVTLRVSGLTGCPKAYNGELPNPD